MGQNAYMSDVPVALISAGSAIIGTAIPQVIGAIKEFGQAKRQRREQSAQIRREACMELLRAIGEFRAKVADLYDHRGDDIDVFLTGVRQSAANTGLCAANVALLPPGSLTDDANQVAAAANAAVIAAEQNPGLSLGAMDGKPDFTTLDAAVSAFRKKAEAEARG